MGAWMPDDTNHGSEKMMLSPQQARVLDLVGEGLTSKEIGKTLSISPHTVDQHCKAAIRNLRAYSRADAARKWRSMSPPQRLVSQPTQLAQSPLDQHFTDGQVDPLDNPGLRDSSMSISGPSGSEWQSSLGNERHELNLVQVLKHIGVWAIGIALLVFIVFGTFNGVQLALERLFGTN